jgi:UDP-N-acetylglucosamine 2-epimerase (non-hydrolysing)
MNRQLIHVEAGIRSFDPSMPEEINRMITDSITDHFFTTTLIANENLLRSGVDNAKIHFVGNTMIDTLLANKLNFKQPKCFDTLSLESKKYWLLTLHRPSNVDNELELDKILTEINNNSGDFPVIFPVHPRTKNTLSKLRSQPNIHFVDPLGYLEFMYLANHAAGVITDSGGIQEETTVLQIPCLTLRKNTERPETISLGTNELIPDLSLLKNNMNKIVSGQWKKGTIPELWDGKTSERILSILVKLYN